MSISRIVFATIAATFLTSAAYAEGASPTNPSTIGAEGGHGMMREMFTPEERMMLFADASKDMANMTDDQRHAYRHVQRDRIMAMSEADRSKFKADLDARWNALSADQKADMTAKMQALRAAHTARDGDK
jgi:hypothetical protein